MSKTEYLEEATKAANEAKAAAAREDWTEWSVKRALAEDLASLANRVEENS